MAEIFLYSQALILVSPFSSACLSLFIYKVVRTVLTHVCKMAQHENYRGKTWKTIAHSCGKWNERISSSHSQFFSPMFPSHQIHIKEQLLGLQVYRRLKKNLLDNKLSPSTFFFFNVTLHSWHMLVFSLTIHIQKKSIYIYSPFHSEEVWKMKGMKGEHGKISLSILLFTLGTRRWKVEHMWVKRAGKDSQYGNQFRQQSSFLGKDNKKRGDALQGTKGQTAVRAQ